MEFSDMVTPGAELVLVLRDGTRVEMANSFGEYGAGWTEPVSYTHLDVYKRQPTVRTSAPSPPRPARAWTSCWR